MEVLALSFATTTALSLAVILYQRHRHSKSRPTTSLVSPDKVSDQVNNLIHSAIKKSETILTEAELSALRELSKAKIQSNKFVDGYDKEFEETVNQIYSHLNQKIAEIESKYDHFVTQIEVSAKENNVKIDQTFNDLITQIGAKLEDNMRRFIEETQKKSLQQLQMELSSARQIIETYKTNQMRLIDENILAVLERTLALVLSKNLSLQDQLDLITEAFDQAKKEKFFL